MLKWGFNVDGNCVFCRNAIETRNHIFFDCSFSKRIWRNVMALCLISDPQFCWEHLVEWGSMHLKRKGLRANLCKLAWWATVYYLWSQKNALLHAGQVKTEDQILNLIKKDVKTRLSSKVCFEDSILKRALCCNWGISSASLCSRSRST
jgi:hypothetical protein